MSERKKLDQQRLDAITKGGSARKKALHEIYSTPLLHQQITMWVKSNSGNVEDAKDILHDGMIVLDRNIRNHKFILQGSLDHYLISICRLLWMNRMRKQRRTSYKETIMPAETVDNDDPEISLLDQEKKELLDQLLAKMDPQCLKILTLWIQACSMQDIADQVGLSSAKIAKKYRYRCTKKMMGFLREDASLFQVLNEIK